MREALEAGRAFDRIVIARGRQDTRVEEIVKLAREHNLEGIVAKHRLSLYNRMGIQRGSKLRIETTHDYRPE